VGIKCWIRRSAADLREFLAIEYWFASLTMLLHAELAERQRAQRVSHCQPVIAKRSRLTS
jgi:hypothetical protein